MNSTHDDAAPLAPPVGRAARLPVVAIVGRPNVGKSTLFNRLVRAQRAIVDSQPGVTRDRNIARAHWDGHPMLLVDTGGFDDADASPLAAAVRAQSLLASEEADAVIVVFDGREGVNPVDRELVIQLRQLRKPVFFAINKLDTPALDEHAADFFELGVDAVFPISVAHGRGINELMDHLVGALAAPATDAGAVPTAGAVTLALVGRPNVGKSSLLNRIVGYDRAIVDATPGTTRDALDTPFRRGRTDYVLVDTAGIRRRPRVQEYLERASVVRSLRALERAEVAILLLDATEGMTDQDARIAGYAWERGRALLFAVNKWDAMPREQRKPTVFREEMQWRYPTLADVPTVFLSALTGSHVADLFPALDRLVAAHRLQVQTARLNEVLEAATTAQNPASVKGRRPRFYYATQTGTAPPVITIFASHPEHVQAAYERYLTNAFRSAFRLYGTPLRVRVRSRRQDGAAE